MSLILEALKKSEQQRRLGEAPTFGSPVVATRKRRSILPLIAILIVAAGAVWWWLGHRGGEPAPVTPAPVASTARQQPPSQQIQTRPAAGTARPAPQRTPPASSAANQDKRAVGVGNVPRTPPNAAPAQAPATAGTAPSAPDKSAGLRAPAPVTPAPAKTDAAAPPKTAATTPAAAPKTEPATTAAPARSQPPPPPAADMKRAAAPPPAAAGAALPTVWELPYATRKDIPAIELSMHVYSSDPKQRFVVIKGDRHVEGDEVGTDLVLKEIRQDGIVLDYKGQVFFYPRSGR
jgi:general secretion pathway protein B